MSRARKQKRDNYLKPMLDATAKAAAEGKIVPGRVHDVYILHDDWCDLLKGKGPCNCEPYVEEPKVKRAPEDN